MYALIESRCVIRVFDSKEEAESKQGMFDSIVPIGAQCLFQIYGNTVVGELVNDGEEWVIQEEYCSHSLEDCDGWQPIGTWLSF